MGNALEKRTQGKERSHGRGWCMVRSDWRFEYGASSLAICRSRGAKDKARDELGGGGMGGNGTQDGAVDPENEKSDTDTNAMEPCRIGDSKFIRLPRGVASCKQSADLQIMFHSVWSLRFSLQKQPMYINQQRCERKEAGSAGFLSKFRLAASLFRDFLNGDHFEYPNDN